MRLSRTTFNLSLERKNNHKWYHKNNVCLILKEFQSVDCSKVKLKYEEDYEHLFSAQWSKAKFIEAKQLMLTQLDEKELKQISRDRLTMLWVIQQKSYNVRDVQLTKKK